MLLLSVEAADNDKSLKKQMAISSINQKDDESIRGQVIRKKRIFLSKVLLDYKQKKCPQNILVYVKLGTISTIKGNLAIYTNCFILGQIVTAQKSPKDIYAYKCKQNEVKMVVPLYSFHTGDFLGLEMRLSHIVLRGDAEEGFFQNECFPPYLH